MADQNIPDRCRIMLIAPELSGPDDERRILASLEGGDVAALVLPFSGTDESAFQHHAETLVQRAQERGVAVLIAGEPRLAYRLKADGVHLSGSKQEIAGALEKNAQQLMIGCDGGKTRDEALEIGESQPDYIFFGRFGYDTKPEPHRRNLTLGQWWSEMVSVPCVVLGGSDIRSVEAVAATGVDFVALSSAVFGEGIDPAEAVREANALLDAGAPRFGT